jgi:hypothetical protein
MHKFIWIKQDDGRWRKGLVLIDDYWKEDLVIVKTFTILNDMYSHGDLDASKYLEYHLVEGDRWVSDTYIDAERGLEAIRCEEHPIRVANDFIRHKREPPAAIRRSDREIASDPERYRAWFEDREPGGYHAWRRELGERGRSPRRSRAASGAGSSPASQRPTKVTHML